MGLTGFVACLCAGVFFGAAAYISLVQHPAALEAGSDVAVRFFPPMYRRAAPMQAGLAVLGTVAGLLRWLVAGGGGWFFGALFLGSVVPLTLAVIKPINDELLTPDRASDPTYDMDLLVRWGQLHWLRTIASGIAFLSFLA
jgi:hypothetical protein